MKNRKLVYLVMLIAFSMILSGCAGNSALNNAVSWPGMTEESGTVYVSYTSSVQAVADGKLVWKYPAEPDKGLMFFASPLVEDGKVYAATYQNEVHVLDQKTGALLNKITLGSNKNKILASPAAGEGKLVIPSNDGSIYGFDLNNLTSPVWTTKHPSEIWVQPLIFENKVYIASLDKQIHVLDLESGKILKSQPSNGAVMSDLILSDGKIYFTTLGKDVSVYDPATDEITSLMTAQNEIWASPLIVDDRIIVADMGGNISCVDLTDGKSVWALNATTPDGADYIANPVALDNGNILFIAENGDLLVYDIDGKSVNVRSANGKMMTTPVIVGDSVITAMIPGDALLRAYTFDLKEDWWYAESTATSTENTPEVTETSTK